jgi:hypothetical protein
MRRDNQKADALEHLPMLEYAGLSPITRSERIGVHSRFVFRMRYCIGAKINGHTRNTPTWFIPHDAKPTRRMERNHIRNDEAAPSCAVVS